MTTTEPTLRPTDCDDHSPAPAGPNEGHLLVRRGLGRTTITTDPALPGLYTARFAGPSPRRSVHGGTVELTYPMMSVRRRRAADVLTLTGSIPWRIEVDGGVGELTADLSDVSLRSVEVHGGVSRTTLELPTPVMPLRMTNADGTTDTAAALRASPSGSPCAAVPAASGSTTRRWAPPAGRRCWRRPGSPRRTTASTSASTRPGASP